MYGFKLIKNEFVQEIGSRVLLYRHYSGARLVYVKNKDKNRVVMPVFKTLPQNDKGIPHIAEHCVLCGSQQYPLKDPFNVLEKGSIYTYLNAITYEDKTVYPVASLYEDELLKMTKVYSDGIFKPLMLENEGIFQQEGVYIGRDGVNGVVLNEMEGAFAREDKLLHHYLRKALYKGCDYANYSGGVPDDIKTLTYEEFKAFYNERYINTGENCLIYIYGDVEIEPYMELFSSYFKAIRSKIDGEKAEDEIKVNNSPKAVRVNAGTEAKELCGALFACCNANAYTECVLLSVLSDVLISGENPLLRQLLVDSGKAVKVKGSYDDSSKATKLYIYAEGADKEGFRDTLQGALRSIVREGIPYELIKAAVDKLRFYVNEKDFGYKPTGLFYGLELMKGLLYDNDSDSNSDSSFQPLRLADMLNKAENADYISLINKYLIDKGVYGYTVREKRESREINMPVNDKPLKDFQAQQDSEEMLNKIPPKSLSDIKPEPLWYDFEGEGNKGVCLFTEDENSSIAYLDIVYPINCLDISDAALYGCLLEDYIKRNERCFGRLNVGVDVFSKDDKILTVLKISTAFIRENIEECVKLINGALGADFIDNKSINRIVLEKRAELEGAFSSAGQSFAVKTALGAILGEKALEDKASGVGMYKYLCEADNFASRLSNADKYINEALPFAVFRGKRADMNYVRDNIHLSESLPELESMSVSPLRSGGFVVGGNVNYNALAVKMPFYKGAMSVAEDIAERGYLWDKIRLEGGAYGGGCGFLKNKAMYLYSYRDPQLERTINMFKAVGDYLAELKMPERELQRFKTGSAARLLRPVKDKSVNSYVLSQALLNKEYSLEAEYVKQRLMCSLEDINNIGIAIRESIDNAAVVSFGGEAVGEYFGMENCVRLV